MSYGYVVSKTCDLYVVVSILASGYFCTGARSFPQLIQPIQTYETGANALKNLA